MVLPRDDKSKGKPFYSLLVGVRKNPSNKNKPNAGLVLMGTTQTPFQNFLPSKPRQKMLTNMWLTSKGHQNHISFKTNMHMFNKNELRSCFYLRSNVPTSGIFLWSSPFGKLWKLCLRRVFNPRLARIAIFVDRLQTFLVPGKASNKHERVQQTDVNMIISYFKQTTMKTL